MSSELEDGFEGHLELVDNGWVLGWAWSALHPEAPVEVDVLVDGVPRARAIANLYRPDLEVAGKGNGRHGFEAQIPESARDGDFISVAVCFSPSGKPLFGSPRSVSFARPEARRPDARGGAQVMGPVYRSRFGGLWPDLSNAHAVIAGKCALGWITPREKELLTRWVEDGFVILPQAVPHDAIDRLEADVERVWSGTSPERCFVEFWEDGAVLHPAGPRLKDKRAKLLDLHQHFESAREVIFAEDVLRFTSLVLERPTLAFQSLYFRWGSRQDIHQDTAFVKVSSPLEFLASWIALEDVQPDSGELEYYKGSHRLEDFLFDGRHKWMPMKSAESDAFHASLHTRSRELGLERVQFRPKKGDVLLWNADLAHGGSPQSAEGLTRKSLVTHYCPVDCDPVYADGRLEASKARYKDSAWYAVHARG
jgi:hypothetical protein